MSAASLAAKPGAAPGPQDQGANKGGRLLGLVRKLVAYGRDLIASLQQQNAPTPSPEVARRFASINLAVIIARITRGIALATGLAERLERRPPAPKTPRIPTIRVPASPGARPTRARTPEPSRAEDEAALLRGLPSAEDIAERIRKRPAGAVIVEICRDLGIDTTHPLWSEIRDAIIQYDGSLVRMLKVWMGCLAANIARVTAEAGQPPRADWNLPLPASTGPP